MDMKSFCENIYFYWFWTSALDGGGCLTPHLDVFSSRKGFRYPLYRRLDGPQGRPGRVWRRENLLPPRRFELKSLHHYLVSAPTTMLRSCVTSLSLLNSTDIPVETHSLLFALTNALQALLCNYRFSSHQWWHDIKTIHKAWSSARTNFVKTLTTDNN